MQDANIMLKFFSSPATLEGDALEAHKKAVERVAQRLIKTANAARDDLITDPEVIQLLAHARKKIANMPTHPDMWEADRVRRTALQFGTSRPILEGDCGIMSVSSQRDVVFGRSEEIRLLSVLDLASTLIHEATHIVWAEICIERMNLSAAEFSALVHIGRPVNYATRVLAECLAYHNQSLWCLANAPRILTDEHQHQAISASLAVRTGERDALKMLALILHMNTLIQLKEEFIGQDIPLIGLRGEWEGMRLPFEWTAPALFIPLINTIIELGFNGDDRGRDPESSMTIDPFRGAILIG